MINLTSIFRCCSALVLLGAVFIFYTIPLTAAAKLAKPDDLFSLIPEIDGVSDENLKEMTMLLSGLLTAGIWSTFFALCPMLFKVRPTISLPISHARFWILLTA
jgi:hypothetical protein